MDNIKNLIQSFKIKNNYSNIIRELNNYEYRTYIEINCINYIDIMNINMSKAYNNYIEYNNPDELLYIYILHYWNDYFLNKKIDSKLFIEKVYNSVVD
jgi:hypothetical protein